MLCAATVVSCAATAGDNSNGAGHDADAVVDQIHQASAAQMRIQAAMMQARLAVQGSRNAVDLVSPSCKFPLHPYFD